ncbi:MAG: hypothetical protein LBC27_05450 [Spirochaetaceae bacterium]|nr:hypothetical protein [Spirochaetaceae bacterium]
MRKIMWFGITVLAASAFISCEGNSGVIDADGDDGTKGNYTITVLAAENGVITASRSKASPPQSVIVNAYPAAASEWAGDGKAPEGINSVEGGTGDGTSPAYPWYIQTLSIKQGQKSLTYKKTAPNEWQFTMPAANVTISATFSQIPVKSSFLAELGVNVPAVITPELSDKLDYTALIPHIVPVAPKGEDGGDDVSEENIGLAEMTFALIAVPEDPNAVLSIKDVTSGSEEMIDNLNDIPLKEGKKKYIITVTRDELPPAEQTRIYNFTVSYEPDLTLKSITLAKPGGGWEQPLPIQNAQTVNIPYYGAITIDAKPSDNEASAKVSLKSGNGSLNGGTLTIPPGSTVTTLSVEIIVEKTTADNSNYEKTYLLNIQRAAPNDPIPTEYRAAGGGISIVKNADGAYDEIHIFTSSGALVFSEGGNTGLNAWVLVVAGGGGSGGADWSGSGAGAGGMIETQKDGNKYSYALSGTRAYNVTVGLGGAGGLSRKVGDSGYTNGSNGGDSAFGTAFIAKGGGAGAKREGPAKNNAGFAGGSSGGGSSSPAVLQGTYPSGIAVSYGNLGGVNMSDGDYSAGGGGAGGPGLTGATVDTKTEAEADARGGPGRVSNITGSNVTYSRGGGTAPGYNWNWAGKTGTPNTGNGGGGSWNHRGGAGGSGIVIVRFPAKPPVAD